MKLWIIFALGAALSWGIYVPMMAAGQGAFGGRDNPNSAMRVFIFIGIAYFFMGLIIPGIWLATHSSPMDPGFHLRGGLFSLLAGTLGALGALGVVFALKYGGNNAAFVAPIVFAGAPIVSVLVACLVQILKGNKIVPPPGLFLGVALAVAGTLLVLLNNPVSHAPPKAATPAAPAAPDRTRFALTRIAPRLSPLPFRVASRRLPEKGSEVGNCREIPRLNAKHLGEISIKAASLKFGWLILIGMSLAQLCGCSITNVQGYDKPYVLSEHGGTLHVYAMDAQFNVIGDGTQLNPVLVWRQVYPWEFWRGYCMIFSPRYRLPEYIWELAHAMGPEYPHDSKVSNIRWIIGTKPLVVAMGTDKREPNLFEGAGMGEQGPINMGETYSMVEESDLDKTATELLVLDYWPKEWPKDSAGHNEQARLKAYADSHKRTIQLDNPKTLRDLMRTRPWEKN